MTGLSDSPRATGVALRNLSPELQAIIAGVQGRVPETERLDWDRVSYLAFAHDVAPLLHSAWSESSGNIPLILLDELQRARRQTALNSALGLCQRDEVLQIFDRAGVQCLVLKGAALARTWYGDLSLRSFIDIDLWVPESEIGRARAALLRDGYRERGGPGVAHHEMPLYKAGLPCAVELHHRLTPLPHLSELDFSEFEARAIVLPSEPAAVRSLAPEDVLLHLCLHLLAHMEPYGWRLRHCCDIARHVTTFAIDWEVFRHRIHATGTARACDAVLGLTGLVTGVGPPPAINDQVASRYMLQYSVPGPKEHRFLAEFLTALRRGDVPRAGAMIAATMDQRNSHLRGRRSRRPRLFVSSVAGLVREGIRRPQHLRRQLRLWRADADSRDDRARTITNLFVRPEMQPPDYHALPALQQPHELEAGNDRTNSLPAALILALLTLSIISIVFRLLFRTVKVRGTSMEPTLSAGQRLIVDAVAYRRSASSRGDVVVLEDPCGRRSLGIKRVIGLPGEKVAIRRDHISINGRRLEEGYRTFPGVCDCRSITVPDASYFVLGDNRRTSVDSRTWGPISGASIKGKVLMSYWPRFRRF